MIINKNPQVLATLFFLFGSVWSIQGQSADLLQIYQKARVADPQYRVADFNHQASREILTQAKSSYLPTVAFRYDRSHTRQEIIESDNVLFNSGETSFRTSVFTLSLTQPVFRYANYVRIKQAHVELKQADAELVNSEQELMLRVVENYINALAAGDNLLFLKSEQAALKKQLELAAARQKAKLGRTSDRLEAEARHASIGADYSEAVVNLQDMYEALAEMTGEYPQNLSQLNAEFPMVVPNPAEAQHWEEAAIKQNWELEAQRQAVGVSAKEIKRQQAGHFPTLDLELSNVRKDAGGTLFGGGSEVETREAMLSLNIPLYQGGFVSSKAREAVFKHESNRAEFMRLSRKVKRDARRTFSTIVNAIERSKALEKEIKAQEEVLKFKQAGYKASLSTNLSVLDAERDLYAAKRDYSRARYDYLLNSLKLKSIVGTLSEKDLLSLNNWLSSDDQSGVLKPSSDSDFIQQSFRNVGLEDDTDDFEPGRKMSGEMNAIVINE